MAYDITNPEKATFVNYINSRDFSEAIRGDVSPEGLCVADADGKKILLAACEVSGTLAAYELTAKETKPSENATEDKTTATNPNGNGSTVTDTTASTADTPVAGQTYVVGNAKYKVTAVNAAGATAAYLGITGKKTVKVRVPATVKIGNTTCKVTAISANALKNNKKLTTVVIGKNVKTIGKKAFYGCKNLKKILIKSKVLKKVGSKAFTGTNKKLVIKVPAKKLTSYRKLLKDKGQAKSAVVNK